MPGIPRVPAYPQAHTRWPGTARRPTTAGYDRLAWAAVTLGGLLQYSHLCGVRLREIVRGPVVRNSGDRSCFVPGLRDSKRHPV